MPAVTKKSAKLRRPKSPKKVISPVQSEFEAPVLFRLPDLTEVHFVLAEPAIQFTSAVIEHVEPAAKMESNAILRPTKPIATNRKSPVTQFVVLAAKNKLAPALGRVARIPYVAPVGLVGVALLLTLGLIYLPWGTEPPSTQAANSNEEVHSPLPAAKSTIVDTKSPAESMESAVADSGRRPLRKIADQLDEQLTENESQDAAIADSPESEPSAIAASPEKEHSFTEPWWRTRPAGHRNTAQVAANEPDAARDEAEDESTLEQNDEPMREEYVASPRTALRKRAIEKQTQERYAEEDEDPIGAPNRDQRTDANVDEDARERQSVYKTRPEEEVDAGEVAESPWRRIRNQRRFAEEKHNEFDEELANQPKGRREPAEQQFEQSTARSDRPAKKPKYRSPAGQEIDLSDEWPTETASRPRNEPKRNGAR